MFFEISLITNLSVVYFSSSEASLCVTNICFGKAFPSENSLYKD